MDKEGTTRVKIKDKGYSDFESPASEARQSKASVQR